MSKDKLLEASIPYKLERDGIYLIEVKKWAITLDEARRIQEYYFHQYRINIQFVFTVGEGFALQAVPSVVSELAPLQSS